MEQVVAQFESDLIGTGNAGWGLDLNGLGNAVRLNTATTTISGTSGEITVDGTTDETWASLASAGNFAVDTASGARIYRG